MPWSGSDVHQLATSIKANLPEALLSLFASPDWSGGKLLQLETDLSRPNAHEVGLNAPWLKAIVAKYRQSIPSGFSCAT